MAEHGPFARKKLRHLVRTTDTMHSITMAHSDEYVAAIATQTRLRNELKRHEEQFALMNHSVHTERKLKRERAELDVVAERIDEAATLRDKSAAQWQASSAALRALMVPPAETQVTHPPPTGLPDPDSPFRQV